MDIGQTSQGGRGKNKRSWTKQKEEQLIDELLNFKNGFKNKLDDILNQKFPGYGLKAIPHTDSKIKCKNNVHGLWNVSFPYFHKLTIIYGPDRATGANSGTFAQEVDNQQNEAINLSRDKPVLKKAKIVKIPTDNKKQKTQKREMSEVVDLTTSLKVMSSNLSGFMNGMNAHMSTTANALSTTQQHKQAILLLGVQGLTRHEALLAAQKMASSPSDLSLFYQSPDEAYKREFIINLIHPHLPRNGNISYF
ncbi:hypothetical protein RND81_01G120800 [Saponaria officinalis]|uniref:Myb/SANT-like domain-containing protein n=1 Tax=Saponaria officinalis TaxID=3572 RepID=A0AAW1N781_SAPOF